MSELGLKCGLEIHQQLEGKKLFCSCPTLLREDEPHFKIKRKLRATAGESGEIDVAALQEQLKGKTFVYEGYHDTTCLVETDSEPPHEVNRDALYTTLQFSAFMKANVSPIVQFMRKTVVDGSNTSGFQRTGLIAQNGIMETDQGKIHITNISLEEDACKIISETANEKTYRLDRLGIPLIEIGTGPDITSPEQCLDVAKKIGLLLRSLPGVKRGLGTIRQDVNVSIAGGTRIEIKGAQELRLLPLFVELEAKRQQELLKIKEELKNKKLNAFSISDLTYVLKNSSSSIIRKTLDKNGKILGLKLSGFSGLLGRELMPKYRVGTELAGRAKVKAGVGGIFHSDELPNYGITEQEVRALRKELDCGPEDALVLVADEENKARTALSAVYERLQELFLGVPAEVRKANDDGTTSYMRPMPGAARMYPETDVPLIFPNAKNVHLPELLEQKIVRFQTQYGLSKDLAEFVVKSEKLFLFEELVQKYPDMKAAYIAETLTSTLLDIKRQYQLDPEKLTDENFKELFRYLSENKIHKGIVLDVLIDMLRGSFSIRHYETLSTEDMHKTLKEIVQKNLGAPFSALMGLAMKQLAGKADGKTISQELQKILKEGHG
ncbi:Glu-tRNA(Gln) amidotransferase subunit GatE [Candidatus Woesearchaeota archaeon]|nr:Glu-tRNA(Gln) amidotransferase subunit GatE [Candidatus Woesearchaeota archaeon]